MNREITNLSNTEINKMIQNTFASEMARNVVRCRIIDGLTCDEIVNRYYNGEFISDKTRERIIRTEIQPLIEKLFKALKTGMPDRGKVKTGIFEMLQRNTWKDIDKERHRFQPVLNNALALLKEQEAEAKWIYGEDKTGVDGWHCSECDFFEPWFYEFTDDIDFIRFYSFCPSCGRKMTSYIGKPTQKGR